MDVDSIAPGADFECWHRVVSRSPDEDQQL
jgi:hypothetical protein